MKKLNIFKTLVLTLTMLSVPSSYAWAQAWDGTTKTAPDMSTNKGTSEALAIQISNAAELAWLGDQMRLGNTANGKTYGNKYWKLMDDIDLGGNSELTGKDWASMIGHTGNAFCGYFDGNNKTVSNIQVKAVTSTKCYGLFTSIQGKSTTDLSTVHDLNISGVFIQATASCAANTRIGGLAGYVKQANISNVDVSNVTFTYTNTITGTNQLGGAIGCMENNTILTNVDVTGVTATFSNTTTGLYVGGIVGASTGTANTNSMTGCDAKTVKVTHSSNITGTTYMGGLVGNANTSLNVINNNTVSGQDGVNDGKGFDVNLTSTTGSAKTFYAGGLFGYCKGTGQEIMGNTVSNVTITTAGTVNDVRLAGFVGSADGTGGLVSVKNNTATTVSITSNGTTAGTNYLGGFIAYSKGKSSPNERVLIQGNTVTTPTVAMNGIVGNSFYEGGFLGYADEHVNLYNNKVTTPAITIANTIKAETYVGGAVGRQNKNTFIDGMTVSGGSINGPTSENKQVNNNVVFFVGGFIGQQNSSGATPAYVTNVFRNIAVSGMTINLGKYVPAGVINNHKFAVGGIAGSVNAPNKDANGLCGMPENIIFKGGSIYAPYAATSPTVPNFNSGTAAHNNLTTEVVTTIDALDKAKVKTWYYSDYELGLSADMLSNTGTYESTPTTSNFRRNYKSTATINEIGGIKYLTVNNSTFQNQNRYQDNDRDSWTVLWWTTQNSWASGGATAALFTKEEQPIYPQYNFGTVGTAELTKFPYYMYFYQGVANANYVTSDVADKIIAGIEGNMTQAAATTPITLTISNDKESERGFAQRTIAVKAERGKTDVTSSYTYQWIVDGKLSSTSSSSLSLTPHWRDGQGITVNALNGTTVIATATYTLAPGVLHTKKSIADASAELVRSDINGRGTKANPYIIDCESALRQWSYLSTAHTATLWESIIKPVSPFPTNQIAGHYGRAYYELGADITMGTDPFIPISHVGYGSDGTYGTYSNNWIFQGNFDGKGKTIKNLHITWGAGQYNGNGTNIYYGLFGAVGHSTQTAKWGDAATSQTVIKNLIIDGAVLTHDVNNTTFSYKKDYTHITGNNFNNCMVGVLAGIVNDYTTIQNIDIRNSKITDETTTNYYDLATQGLYVGGAIGSVQRDYKTTSTAFTSVDIQHIAAKVDITLTYPVFTDPNAKAQVGLFNVGGIVGRYMATSATQAQIQAVMPKYTIYSGTINAEKAWISPVIAATRFTGQNGGDYQHFSKQWEGNNNSETTQITITNAQYYNFNIYYDGGNKAINESYPANTCKLGFRPITPHADGQTDAATTYSASKYQGVNYGVRYVAENTTLELLNKERTDGYSFVWDGSVVKMTTDTYVELSLVRVKDSEGNEIANKFNAVMEGATPTSYKWEVSFDGTNWHEITDVTTNEYFVPVSLKPKYVKASTEVNTKTYTTLIEIVEADRGLVTPEITKTVSGDNSVFTFALNQDTTDPMAELTATYQWYEKKDTPISSAEQNKPMTLANSTLASYNNVVYCKVIVTELTEQIAEYFLVNGATVVYVDGKDGIDNDGNTYTGRGYDESMPVKTIDHANSLLKSEANGGTIDNNIIVIMGILNEDYVFHSSGTNPATLTGNYNNTDYKGVIRIKQVFPSGGEHNVNAIDTKPKEGTNCYVLGDTKFENLMFYGMQEGNSFIELHGHDAIFGKGLVMKNFKNLSLEHGNMNNSETIPEFTIILYATNINKATIDKYTKRIHDRGTPQTVTFQSGHYGRLMGGRFTQNFFNGGSGGYTNNTAYSILASAEYPVWAVVNVEIDEDNEMTDDYDNAGSTRYSRDVNAIIAGLTDGSMYGDYTINFYGGNVAYIVGANQGNPVKNGTKKYTPTNGTEDTWGEWPNASYFGRTVINIDQKQGVKDITVGNLYAGGLGRKVQTGSASAAVDMYVYGRTEVNVKNGTVSGSVYGGGVGGVLGFNPWDAHVPYATDEDDTPANAIINKVQYGDTRFSPNWGTTMTETSPMAKVKLHNLNAEGNVYEKEYLDLRNTSTTVNISGGQVSGNVYGGGYGYVQDMPTKAAVQGVGSVFGTANINITGGTITGNIYGGSQGHTYYYNQKNQYNQTLNHIAEMNGTVNINVTGTEEKCPTIKGDIYGAGQGISSGSRIATQDDVDAGRAQNVGDSFNEEYLRIATTGNTDLGSTEEEKNKYKSTVNITIDIPDTKAIEGNIFGGGRMGAVDGDINVVINGGQINGNVYGGGKGEKGHLQKARVNGTTNVQIGY